MSNAPATESAPVSFLGTWISALTKPREATYAAIAASPKARAMTGYLWVFLGSVLASVATVIIQGATIRARMADAGVGTDRLGGGAGAAAFTLVCATPILAVLATAFFAIWVALVQWIAKMFGGKGTNDQLAYTLAAIAAPYAVVSSIIVLLSGIPFVGLCFSAVLGIAGIYIAVLQIMAVKAVNRFDWGPAFGAWIIPGLAVTLVCCCAIAIGASIAGVAFGDIFKSINQSLVQ